MRRLSTRALSCLLSVAFCVSLGLVSTSAANASSGYTNYRVLQHGDNGPAVGWVQRKLNLYDSQHFGRPTVHRVERFQHHHSLKATGHVNDATWTKLENKFGKYAPAHFVSVRTGDAGWRVKWIRSSALLISRHGSYGGYVHDRVRHVQNHHGLEATGTTNYWTWKLMHHVVKQRKLRREYHRVMRIARNQFGDPYVYGASGPNSFDCSGYTRYVYEHAAGKSLPHSSSQQYAMAKHIPRSSARRGDLVFFHSGGGVYHVGLYAGHGYIDHAPYPGRNVHRERIWTSNISFGRVL
jgi:hypothetical protein